MVGSIAMLQSLGEESQGDMTEKVFEERRKQGFHQGFHRSFRDAGLLADHPRSSAVGPASSLASASCQFCIINRSSPPAPSLTKTECRKIWKKKKHSLRLADDVWAWWWLGGKAIGTCPWNITSLVAPVKLLKSSRHELGDACLL
jgi:hypothetical protein